MQTPLTKGFYLNTVLGRTHCTMNNNNKKIPNNCMFAPVPTLNAQRPCLHKVGLCLLRSELTTQLCNCINQVACRCSIEPERFGWEWLNHLLKILLTREGSHTLLQTFNQVVNMSRLNAHKATPLISSRLTILWYYIGVGCICWLSSRQECDFKSALWGRYQ